MAELQAAVLELRERSMLGARGIALRHIGQQRLGGEWAAEQLRPDAVPAAFTYADFAAGTTDARGYVLNAKWKFAQGMAFKVTEFGVAVSKIAMIEINLCDR